MRNADLPREKAVEPNECAYQPTLQNNMPPFTEQNAPKKLTFAKNVDLSEKPFSQSSSSYKDVLSQPPSSISHVQKLLWLQKRRTAGLWAQCDNCDRWRYLSHIVDRHELPHKWYCSMNPDPDYAHCSIPEAPLRIHDEEDLIHSEYTAGSVVWARLTGWPWWPAMVDDCPDAEQFYWLDGFSDIPTHYNVVFFDNIEVTRAWIAPENLKPYAANKDMLKHLLKNKNKKYIIRLRAAVSQADEANNMTLPKRLEKFSFLSRHKGRINSPKKLNKNDLIKYQKRFKRKFNIDFPIEDSESDDDRMNDKASKRNSNVIILGTPKRTKKGIQASKKRMPAKTVSDVACDTGKQSNASTEVQNSKEDGCVATNTDNKPSNSMLVQVGSTEATSIDNDTSTTYLPDGHSEKQDYSIRIETPNSDDFDF